MYRLAAAGIALCVYPQNQRPPPTPPPSWGICRIIHFANIGLIVGLLFSRISRALNDRSFRSM